MLSCSDVTRLISESMDRSLPPAKRFGVRVHLLICRFCTRYRRQLLLLREAARRFAAAERGFPGEALSAEARERIRKSLPLP
jgi:hypothetical protein